MSKRIMHLNSTIAVRACCLGALVNGFSTAAHAQDLGRNPDLWHTQDATTQDPKLLDPWKREPETTLRYGAIDVFPFIRGGVVYDDNIYITERNKQNDVIWTVSPGALFAAGDYRQKEENFGAIQYVPTFLFFTDQNVNNAIDHDAQGRIQFHPGSWTLQLYQGFQRYSGAVADVGQRVSRSIYSTEASVRYDLSPKTSVELRGRQSIIDYDEGIATPVEGYSQWEAGAFLDYWLTPKLRVGPGINVGWIDVPASENQTYQQLVARASYSVTEKVDINGSIGMEVREFQGDQDNRWNAVFSVGAVYRPLQNTLLSLDAYRRDETSVALINQNYTLTGFSASVRQNLAVLYTASLTGGYYHAAYHSTVQGVSATRRDDHFYLRTGIDWNASGRFTVGAFYQFRNNESTSAGYGFQNNQVGLTANYRF
ncbi:MAG: hypothetical protein QOF48_2832 [Verrucomicrobiota bacterium]|jgi:hypothetical protein